MVAAMATTTPTISDNPASNRVTEAVVEAVEEAVELSIEQLSEDRVNDDRDSTARHDMDPRSALVSSAG